MVVANLGQLKLIADSDKKTDRVDARELAQIVRLNSVPESYVPTDEIREVQTLMRSDRSWPRTELTTRTRFTDCFLSTG